MAIIVNNTDIPTNGNYINVGNVNIDKVICNGVIVWEKLANIPIYADPSSRRIEWVCSAGQHVFTQYDGSVSNPHGGFSAYIRLNPNDDPGFVWVYSPVFSTSLYSAVQLNRFGVSFTKTPYRAFIAYSDDMDSWSHIFDGWNHDTNAWTFSGEASMTEFSEIRVDSDYEQSRLVTYRASVSNTQPFARIAIAWSPRRVENAETGCILGCGNDDGVSMTSR